jgi:hypothetical protein
MPLKRTVLCLDCEMCFGIGSTNCPACGSESWVALNRFLLGAPAKRRLNIVRHSSNRLHVNHDTAILLIIGRDQPGLYEKLKAAFAGESNARVILDRRRGDRRSQSQGPSVERRRADRRTRPAVDTRVRALGWAAVRLGAEKSSTRAKPHHQSVRTT